MKHGLTFPLVSLAALAVAIACGDDDSGKARSAGGTGAAGSSGSSGRGAAAGSSGAGGSAGSSAGTGGENGGAAGSSGGTGGVDASSGGADSGTGGAGASSDAAGGSAGSDAGGDGGSFAPCTAAAEEPAQFTPSTALSDADVDASFAAIAAILKARPNVAPGQAKAEAIRAAVRSAPRVASTAIAPDCTVIVRLSDGTPLSIYDDSALETADAGAPVTAAPAVAPRQGLLAAAPTSFALPESDKVLLGSMFYPQVVTSVAAAFRKRGYAPEIGMTSTVLRDKVKDLGVLWVNTHASPACVDTKGNKHFCILTGDPEAPSTVKKCTLSDPAQCALNDLDVRADRASYAMSSSGTANTFAINDAWIMQYWSFVPNSLVFIDSCGSMRNFPVGGSQGWNGQELRNAILAKRAGTVLGWSNSVGTYFSGVFSLYFFNRVLGGDEDPLSPPQRPFSVPEVVEALGAKGMTVEPKTQGNYFMGSALIVHQFSEAATILAPSLRNVTIGDPAAATTANEKAADTELHLFGEFGTKAGQVRVSDTPVSLKGAWDSKHLVALIPKSGATSSGPVRVVVTPTSRAISGNAVPLTSWRGTARAKVTFTTFGSPGPFSEISCSALHYRGDVHPFRMAPEEQARAGTAGSDDAFQPLIEMPNAVGDTLCGGNVGGSFANATLTAATRANIPWIVNETPAYPAHPGWWFIVTGKIDTSNANAFTFWVASKTCTEAVFHYPPPGSNVTVPDFCMTAAPASFGTFTPPRLLPGTFNMLQPKVGFTTSSGDTAEVEFDLKAESPPTGQTEG